MAQKRMRVFAGPNGSGKTTIITDLKNKFSFGVYVNADDIESSLAAKGLLDLNEYNLQLSTDVVQSFFKQSELSPKKNNSENYWQNLCIKDNQLIIRPSIKIDSYLAADVAELLRQHLLTAGISFTFETVMSHPSKISFLKKALEEDYRVYLYYIATDDPEININRVNVRVAQQGHNVAPEVIRKRYYKSLENLKEAIKQTSRTYVFDNSGSISVLIAEVTNGTDVHVLDHNNTPAWLVKYLAE